MADDHDAGTRRAPDPWGAPLTPPVPRSVFDAAPARIVVEAPVPVVPSLPPRGPDPVQGGWGSTATVPAALLRAADPFDQPIQLIPEPLGRTTLPEPPEPLPLIGVGAARWFFVVTAVAAVLANVVVPWLPEDEVSPGSGSNGTSLVVPIVVGVVYLLLYAATVLWGAISVDNGRRVLAGSRRIRGVSPLRLVVWWKVSIAVQVLAAIGLHEMFYDDRGELESLSLFSGLAILGLWAAVWMIGYSLPYLYLRKVMAKTKGDPAIVTKWIWYPVLALVASVVGVLGVLVGPLGDDGSIDQTFVLAAVLTVLSVLPVATWCWAGGRAMQAMSDVAVHRVNRMRQEREIWLVTHGRAGRFVV